MKKLFAIILSLGLIIAPMPVAHAGGGGGYAKQILGMANGIMGASILMKCKTGTMQMSVLAYLAGGLVYVAGEMLGGKTQGKKQKSSADQLNQTKDTMKEGGDYQKAVIQSQIDNEKSTLEVIQKRRKWMMATKVVYGIATVLAILEIWWALPYPAGINKPNDAACQSNEAAHKGIEKAIILAYASLQSAGGSIKGAAMGLAMGALAKFVLKIEIGNTVADKAIGLLSSAYGRVAFFGASTALVMLIDGDLKKEETASKKRIADLEQVKSQFEAADNSLAEGPSSEAEGADGDAERAKIDPSKKTYALKALPLGHDLGKHCYSQQSSGLDYSEAGCKNPIKLTRPKFDVSMNIPALVAGANTATDMAQAVANGDLVRADIEAGNLAAQAGRIDAINKDLMKKLNDKLKKDGKKPIDINGELNRQITELNKGLNQANPGSGNFTLADVSGDSAGVSETAADASALEITTATSGATVAAPAAGDTLDLSKIGEGGLTDESLLDPNANGKVASLDESLNDYESTEGDISKDRDVSIFKQVSNRYFLNYTKIFQRKEINPPLAEPAPAP